MRAGLGVNHQGLSWILLKAVGVSVEQLDRLLQPLNGNLPQDEQQFVALLERLRRQGHLYEGSMRHPTQQAGAGDPGMYHFYPTFDSAGETGRAAGQQPAFHASSGSADPAFSGSGMPDDVGMYVGGPGSAFGNACDDERCHACGMYYDDADISSATETDTGSRDDGILEYHGVEIDGDVRFDATARQNAIYQDYLLARRRWRRFTGKPPRRYRKASYKPGRFIPKLKNSPYSRSYATFLPPSAFAGGKGNNKGSSKGYSRKNPKGKDGQILKCAKCGSDEHLWRKCPQVVNKGQGKGSGMSAHVTSEARVTDMANNVPASLALTTMQSAPTVETWHSGAAMGLMPGVAFHYMGSSRPASEVGSRVETTLDEELAKLESVSQISARSRKSKRSSDDDVGSPPMWSPLETPKASGATSSGQPGPSVHDDGLSSASAVGVSISDPVNRMSEYGVEALRPGANAPRFPPPTAQGPSEQDIERQKTVLQLHSLLMTWWEAEGRSFNASAHNPEASTQMYHLKTRLEGNRPGLLVDPGAHDNLVGGQTAARMQETVGIGSKTLRMDKSLSVEGVGKSSQSASTAQRLALKLCTDEGHSVNGTYTAPVIEGSELPPLLGLRSLKAFKAILDMGQNKLIIPGPAGCQIQRSPGTVAYDLVMSESGHLILPIDSGTGEAAAGASGDRLDFTMTCRKGDRSKSPAPRSKDE